MEDGFPALILGWSIIITATVLELLLHPLLGSLVLLHAVKMVLQLYPHLLVIHNTVF